EPPPEIARRFLKDLARFRCGRGRHQGPRALGIGAQPFSEISSVRYRFDSFPIDGSPFGCIPAAAILASGRNLIMQYGRIFCGVSFLSIGKVLVVAGALGLMGVSNSWAEEKCECDIKVNPVAHGYPSIYIVARNNENEKWKTLGPMTEGKVIRTGVPAGW